MEDRDLTTWYCYNWFKFTFPIFTLLAFYMVFWGANSLPQIQVILLSSFMALLIHQFEEYVLPGGGPVVVNMATFGEKVNYMKYPGNMLSSMIVNHLAWITYLLAFFFPQLIWLGLGTMFFNLFQFIGHGIQMNKALKTWYNSGLASVIFLFIPISIYYMVFITENNLVSLWDWIFGGLTFVLSTALTVIFPVQKLKNINTKYPCPEYQLELLDKVRSVASFNSKKIKTMKYLLRNFYNISVFIGLAIIAYTIYDWNNLHYLSALALLNLAVINFHFYEEFGFPGGFPYFANMMFGYKNSPKPDRYPLNQMSAFLTNWGTALVMYLPPVFLPDKIWLGLTPILFGTMQVVVHGIVNNKMLKTWYNGGLATALFGHLPIAIFYIKYITENNLATVWDYVIAFVLMVVWYVVGIRIFINKAFESLESPYPFAPEEMTRFEKFYGKERLVK